MSQISYPSDWAATTLGGLESRGYVELGRGKVISRLDLEETPGPYPVYSSSATGEGVFGHYGQFAFDEELITWSIDGGGRFFYRPRHRFSVTNVCGYLRVNSSEIDCEFLAYQLQFLHSKLQFDYTYKAHPSVIRSAYAVALPTLPEQRAIATALGDVDRLVESLDDLIRKKQHVAEGVRTQLLTSTTRLPGFSDPWEIKRLNELGGLFLKGGGISKRDLTAHGAPCILYGEIYTHHHHWVRRLTSHIPYELTSRAAGLQAGDLLFAASGETADEIGKCVAYVGNSETAYAGGDIIIFRNAGIDPKFGGYALNSSKVQVQKSRLGQGATVSHISSNHLAQLELEIPTSREEQEAIAEVLADMDAEIDALVTQRDKTAQLKQAMMQELLTGRTRLS